MKRYRVLESLARIHDEVESESEVAAFAILRHREQRTTSKGKPFFELTLADLSASVSGKIWDDQKKAMAAVRQIRPGTPVKVGFKVASFRGALQVTVQDIRAARPDDAGFDPVRLFGEVPDWLTERFCRTLVLDIETVPDKPIRDMPQTIVKSLTEHCKRQDIDQSAAMGLSPFFGKVVSLAFGDGETVGEEPGDDEGITVMVVPPEDQASGPFPGWVRPVSEPELLHAFWALASAAELVVTYNGRGFDIPFLVARSLVQGIPARVDLLSNRYSLKPHLDLFDVLGQRGRGPANLDVVCWALGIHSPKGEMDGSMVAPAYQRGKIVEIAQYNREDVRATTAVYRQVKDLVLRYRRDWD